MEGVRLPTWGDGMFESMFEYLTIHQFDEELGLRELRAKINDKAGVPNEPHPNQFSINADYNYGTKSIDITRAYLDSGALERLLKNDLWKGERCWAGSDGHRYITLVASVMSLGCKLPERIKETLEVFVGSRYLQHVRDAAPEYARSSRAIGQLRKAIGTYEEGVPYKWGNISWTEKTAVGREPFHFLGYTALKTTNFGMFKHIDFTLTLGTRLGPAFRAPPTDKELDVTPIYAANLCASCGKDKKEDDSALQMCGRCKDRKYCSKECQKQHWSLHKFTCTAPAASMAAFMAAVPYDAIQEDVRNRDEDFKKAGGLDIANCSRRQEFECGPRGRAQQG